MSRAPGGVALLGATAVLVAGCGGGGGATTGSKPTPTPLQERGKAIFVRSCGSCHTLADAGTAGIVGMSLDETRPTRAAVLRALAAPPDKMPRDLVASAADARAVAAYVAAAVRRD